MLLQIAEDLDRSGGFNMNHVVLFLLMIFLILGIIYFVQRIR